MTEKKTQTAFKWTLTTGKTVTLLDAKVSDMHKSLESAGILSQNNQSTYAMTAQDELLKRLLVQVNGEDLTDSEKLDFDAMFVLKEYLQIVQILGKQTDAGEGLGKLVPVAVTV